MERRFSAGLFSVFLFAGMKPAPEFVFGKRSLKIQFKPAEIGSDRKVGNLVGRLSGSAACRKENHSWIKLLFGAETA